MSTEALLLLVAVAYGLVNALLQTTGKRADGPTERRAATSPGQPPQAGRRTQPASAKRAAPAQSRQPAPMAKRTGARPVPRTAGSGTGSRFARSVSSVRRMRQRARKL
jgi:hypothetical protein